VGGGHAAATNGHSTASPSNMRGTAASGGGAFFARHMRKLSSSLPRFHPAYAEKDKRDPGGERSWGPNHVKVAQAVKSILARTSRKLKLRIVITLFLLLLVTIFCNSRKLIGVVECGQDGFAY
jgi:mannan polymerase II complex MNN10 subunit